VREEVLREVVGLQRRKMTGIDSEDTKTDDEDGFLNVSKTKALEEEERRREFDAILKKPVSHWSGVDSEEELKAALSALLFGLRSSTPDSLGDGTLEKQTPDRSSRPLSAVSISYQNFAAPEDDQQYERRSEFIPLRISDQERSLLATVEAALDVSDYSTRRQRLHRQGRYPDLFQCEDARDHSDSDHGLLVHSIRTTDLEQLCEGEEGAFIWRLCRPR